jgi:hypothetical protein
MTGSVTGRSSVETLLQFKLVGDDVVCSGCTEVAEGLRSSSVRATSRYHITRQRCQSADWKAGHKAACEEPQPDSCCWSAILVHIPAEPLPQHAWSAGKQVTQRTSADRWGL